MKRFLCVGIPIAFLLLLNSCATAPIQTSVYAPYSTVPIPPVHIRGDVIHTVAPGETVWRMSKMYDVRIEDILQANRLKSAEEIEMGRHLLIPNAAPLRPVIPLYPSKKWKYIIIHHSATDEGDALRFHFSHNLRGFTGGLGYHFVIDNGTVGKQDGQIEVSPRWLKQQDGAHCQVSGMNYKAIGICLVGNFSKERVSEKQMDSLVYLVNSLRKRYRIPFKNMMGHGQVPDSKTECPGKNFPWGEFKNKLKELDYY